MILSFQASDFMFKISSHKSISVFLSDIVDLVKFKLVFQLSDKGFHLVPIFIE